MNDNRKLQAATARAAATKRLIDAHAEEFAMIYAEEREAKGLEVPPELEVARLRARIVELETRQ